jgi:cell division protein DivIC
MKRGVWSHNSGLFGNEELPGKSSSFILKEISIFVEPFFKLMLKQLPRAFRNFYLVTGVSFLIWLTFLDSNDLISRFKMGAKLRALEDEKEYYIQKVAEVEKDRTELMTNKELLEKFAREKYLMKKETEDIFVIEETD